MKDGEVTHKRDPELKRTSIREAAQKLFVEKGFAPTSMNDIAREAQVTKSLIHHYFESKEHLWLEIKRELQAEWGKAHLEIIGIPQRSTREMMRRSIEGYFLFLQENPDMVRLSSWMNLEDPKFSQLVNPTLITKSCESLTAAQESGDIRSDVDVHHVLAMLISLTEYWFVASNALNQNQIGSPGEAAADESYLKDMMKIFIDGLAVR